MVAHLLSVISHFLKEKKEFHARSGHWDQPSSQGLLTVKFCFCKGIHRRDCTPKKTWHAGFYWHTGDRYRLCNILSGRCPLPMELTGLYRRSFPGPPRCIFVLYARDPVMVTKEEKTNRSIRVSRLVTGHWRRYWRGMLQRWVNYWYEGPFFTSKYMSTDAQAISCSQYLRLDWREPVQFNLILRCFFQKVQSSIFLLLFLALNVFCVFASIYHRFGRVHLIRDMVARIL